MSEDPRRALREKFFGDPNIVSGVIGFPETFLTLEQFKAQLGLARPANQRFQALKEIIPNLTLQEFSRLQQIKPQFRGTTEQQRQSITTPAPSPSFRFPKISAPQGIGIGGLVVIGIIAFLLLRKKR